MANRCEHGIRATGDERSSARFRRRTIGKSTRSSRGKGFARFRSMKTASGIRTRIFGVDVRCVRRDADDQRFMYSARYVSGERRPARYERMPKALKLPEFENPVGDFLEPNYES